MKEADAFVRIAGARTAPYRVATGGKSTSRTYVCRSHKRSRFKKNVATGEAEENGAEDDGDEDGVQEDDDAGCPCNAMVVIQECTVRSLMQGTFRKKRSTTQEEVEAGVEVEAGCGLRAAGCELWAVGCGLWAVGCGLWAVGCGRLAMGGGLSVVGRGRSENLPFFHVEIAT